MLNTNQLNGFGVAQNDPELTYIASYSGSGGDSVTQTVSLGEAKPGRYIVIFVGLNNGNFSTISDVSLGGVSATNVVIRNTFYSPCGFWVISSPTGTSDTLTITGSGGTDYWTAAIYTLYNAQSPLSPFYTNTNSTLAQTQSLAAPSSFGVVLAGSSVWLSQATSYDANTIEDWELSPQGTQSCGHRNIYSTSNISVTYASTPSNYSTLIVAAWN